MYIHKYLHMYLPTYVHTYICTYLHTYIFTYVHTYIHSYIHTYIHSYIHTYTKYIKGANLFCDGYFRYTSFSALLPFLGKMRLEVYF